MDFTSFLFLFIFLPFAIIFFAIADQRFRPYYSPYFQPDFLSVDAAGLS